MIVIVFDSYILIAGELLKKGPNSYALRSVPSSASQQVSSQVSGFSSASQAVSQS